MAERKTEALMTERLRRARENRGIKQRDLARLCGIGENQINRYENGGGDPSSANLKMIAQTLEVSTDYLLGLSDDPRGLLNEVLTPSERKLIAAYYAGDGNAIIELVYERLQQLSKISTGE